MTRIALRLLNLVLVFALASTAAVAQESQTPTPTSTNFGRDTVHYTFGTLSDRWTEKEGTYRLEILKGELLPSNLWNVDSMKFSNEFQMN